MKTEDFQALAFSPEEAARIQIQSIGSSGSGGDGIFGVPHGFTTPDVQYRIRITMLNAMGETAPGLSLDILKAEFMGRYRGVLAPMTFTLFNAEWDYLASMREALCATIGRAINSHISKRRVDMISILRAFVRPYHVKGQHVDFILFAAYVRGFAPTPILNWIHQIWDTFELSENQTFWRKLKTLPRVSRVPLSPPEE